jgi:hypothetical protein
MSKNFSVASTKIAESLAHGDYLPLAKSIFQGSHGDKELVLKQISLIHRSRAHPYIKVFALYKLAEFLYMNNQLDPEIFAATTVTVQDMMNNRLPPALQAPEKDQEFERMLNNVSINLDNINDLKKIISPMLPEGFKEHLDKTKDMKGLTSIMDAVSVRFGNDYLGVLSHILTAPAIEPPPEFVTWGMDVNDKTLQERLKTTRTVIDKIKGLKSEKLRGT